MLYKPLYWKVTFPVTSKPTPPTVFNLQASEWNRCAYWNIGMEQVRIVEYRNGTGAHTGISEWNRCAYWNIGMEQVRILEYLC